MNSQTSNFKEKLRTTHQHYLNQVQDGTVGFESAESILRSLSQRYEVAFSDRGAVSEDKICTSNQNSY